EVAVREAVHGGDLEAAGGQLVAEPRRAAGGAELGERRAAEPQAEAHPLEGELAAHGGGDVERPPQIVEPLSRVDVAAVAEQRGAPVWQREAHRYRRTTGVWPRRTELPANVSVRSIGAPMAARLSRPDCSKKAIGLCHTTVSISASEKPAPR